MTHPNTPFSRRPRSAGNMSRGSFPLQRRETLDSPPRRRVVVECRGRGLRLWRENRGGDQVPAGCLRSDRASGPGRAAGLRNSSAHMLRLDPGRSNNPEPRGQPDRAVSAPRMSGRPFLAPRRSPKTTAPGCRKLARGRFSCKRRWSARSLAIRLWWSGASGRIRPEGTNPLARENSAGRAAARSGSHHSRHRGNEADFQTGIPTPGPRERHGSRGSKPILESRVRRALVRDRWCGRRIEANFHRASRPNGCMVRH